MKKDIVPRLMFVLSGFVAAALLIEASLFFVGRVWSLKLAARDGAVALRQGSFRVLCVGDSYTYGQGAPKGMDYPSRLSGLFSGSGINAQVINRGRPGANTRVMLERLENDIQETNPSVVCILAGRANDWNSYGLENLDTAPAVPWWKRLKMFTLTRLLYLNIARPWRMEKHGLIMPESTEDQGSDYYLFKLRDGDRPVYERAIADFYKREFDSAFDGFSVLCRKYPEAFEYYQLASQCLIAQGDNARATEFLELSLADAPGVAQLYEYLAKEYIEAGRDGEAVELAVKSIKQAPDEPLFFDVAFYVFQYANTPDAKERILAALSGLNTKTAEKFYQRLLMFENNDTRENVIRRWVLTDLRRIIKLCRSYGAVVVLCSYPQDRFMSSDFRQLARDGKHMFCDHYGVFSTLPPVERAQYFAIDGHCNGAGYRLMAQNVFEALCVAGLCQPGTGGAERK